MQAQPRWQTQGHGASAQSESAAQSQSPTRALLLAANAGPASYYPAPTGTQAHFTPLHGGAISAYLPSLLLQPGGGSGGGGVLGGGGGGPGPGAAGAQLNSSPYLASPFQARSNGGSASASPALSSGQGHSAAQQKKWNRQSRKAAGGGGPRRTAPSSAAAGNGAAGASVAGAQRRSRAVLHDSIYSGEGGARRHALNPAAGAGAGAGAYQQSQHGHGGSPSTPSTSYFPPPSSHQYQQQMQMQFGQLGHGLGLGQGGQGQSRMFQRKGLPPSSLIGGASGGGGASSSSSSSVQPRPFSSGSSLSPLRRGAAGGALGGDVPPPLGLRHNAGSRSLTSSPTSQAPAPQPSPQHAQQQQQQRGQRSNGPNGAAAPLATRMGSPPLSPLIKPQQVVVDTRPDQSASGGTAGTTAPAVAAVAEVDAEASSAPGTAPSSPKNGSAPLPPMSADTPPAVTDGASAPAPAAGATPAPAPAVAPVAVLSNTTPDLLFLLSPAEHQALMSLLRARIDGKGSGALLTVSDATKAIKADSASSSTAVAATAATAAPAQLGASLGLPPHSQSPTSGSLRRPSFSSGSSSLLAPTVAAEAALPPPHTAAPSSPSRLPLPTGSASGGLTLNPSLLGPPTVAAGGGAAGSSHDGSLPLPLGSGAGSPSGVTGGGGPSVRVRSKSFSARVSLPRRPSLQSVREEGGGMSFGGMLLPPGLPLAHASPQQLQVPQAQSALVEPLETLEIENEEEAQREQMLRAIAAASAASSTTSTPKHGTSGASGGVGVNGSSSGAASPLSEYGATGGRGGGIGIGIGGGTHVLGLGARRSSIPSMMGLGVPAASSASAANLSLGGGAHGVAGANLGADRPRASSLFVKRSSQLGGGGLITLPPNWSRQGSTISLAGGASAATGDGSGNASGSGGVNGASSGTGLQAPGGDADAGDESDCESSVIEPAPGASLAPLRLPPSAHGGGQAQQQQQAQPKPQHRPQVSSVPPMLHRARSAAAALNPPGYGLASLYTGSTTAASSRQGGAAGPVTMSERCHSAHLQGADSPDADDGGGASTGFGHPSFAPGPQVSAGSGNWNGAGGGGGGRRAHPNRFTMAAPFSASVVNRLHGGPGIDRMQTHVPGGALPTGSFVSRAAAMAASVPLDFDAPLGDPSSSGGGVAFDPEREENGGQYWSLSHASLLLERIALERTLAPQFESYLTQALESIATARAIVAHRMAKRVAIEEKLKSHPEQVADWLSEFAVGTAAVAEGEGGGSGTGVASRSSSRGATGSASATPSARTRPISFHTPLTTPKMSFSKPGGELSLVASAGSGSLATATATASTPVPAASSSSSTSSSSPSPGPALAASQVSLPPSPMASAIPQPASTALPSTAATAPTATAATTAASAATRDSTPSSSSSSSGADGGAIAAFVSEPDPDDVSGSLSLLDSFLLRDPVVLLLERATEWDFELFELHALSGGHSLLLLSLHLLRVTGLPFHFPHLDMDKYFSFFRAIESGYNADIAYHNSEHGADVLQGMVFFMNTPLLRDTLTPLDVLAGLTAAACHDYEHLGRNNAFMVATGHRLAVLYNDTSVMESHHASAAWSVLLRPENDFLSSFRAEERAEFRATFLSAILHTDMSMHMKSVLEFEASVKSKRTHSTWFSQGSKEDRKLLLDMACHVSDLGNPAKPAHLAREWTRRVVEEFWSQGDAELEAGLKVSPMMDRKTAAVDAQQYGFIDFIVGPLVGCNKAHMYTQRPLWADALEPAAIAPCLEHLSINKAYYKSRLPPPAHTQTQPQTPVAAPINSPSSPPSAKHSPSPSLTNSSGSGSSGLVLVSPTPRRGSTLTSLSPASKRNSINFPQLQLQLLPASALQSSPWKNGGGSTRELVCWPAGSSLAAGNFVWRASSATIRAPGGPFSSFPSRTRLLALMDGPLSGMRLCVEGEPAPRLMLPDDPPDRAVQRFDGGAVVSAELDADAPDIQDVGLIFGGGVRADGTMHRLEAGESAQIPLRSAPSRQQLLVVLLRGAAQVAFAPAAVGSARPQPLPLSLAAPLDCAFVPDVCADGAVHLAAQTSPTALLVFHIVPVAGHTSA